MADEAAEGWRIAPMQIAELPGSIEIGAEGLTIGRDPSNALALSADRFPTVSGSHARLIVEGDDLVVEDLGSRNGTLVNGAEVTRQALKHGDAIQLGPDGPRFVAMSRSNLDQTVAVPRAAVPAAAAKHTIGDETMHIVRSELGIPAGRGVQQELKRRSRRHGLLAVLVLVVVGGTIYGAFRALREKGLEVAASLEKRAEELERGLAESLVENRAAVEAQRRAWRQHAANLDEARGAWEAHRTGLIEERERLESGIKRIEEDERAAEGELGELRLALEETRVKLAKYDPVNLEDAKLETVGRIEQAVVLIEARETLVEESSGDTLYIDQSDLTSTFNFEGNGTPFAQEGSGSGFCISPEGWIVTNAHVVFKLEGDDDLLELSADMKLVPKVELSVVFTGQSERRPARIVAYANSDKEDLALIKIEPFEGMPHIEGFDLDTPLPRRGTEVFLLGFPLGKEVLMEGDTMLASTFRGIVSRAVDYYLQVDAAVHPGASGGPVIDNDGDVIGVVTGMQVVDPYASSSAIGYIIPVAEVGKIWPPPEERTDEGDEESARPEDG